MPPSRSGSVGKSARIAAAPLHGREHYLSKSIQQLRIHQSGCIDPWFVKFPARRFHFGPWIDLYRCCRWKRMPNGSPTRRHERGASRPLWWLHCGPFLLLLNKFIMLGSMSTRIVDLVMVHMHSRIMHSIMTTVYNFFNKTY